MTHRKRLAGLASVAVALGLAATLCTAVPASAASAGRGTGTVSPMTSDKSTRVSVGGHTWYQELHLEGHSTVMDWATISASSASSGDPLDYPTGVNCTVQSGFIFWQGGNGTHSHWSSLGSCSAFKADPTYIFTLNVNWGAGTFCVYQYFPQYAKETPGTCTSVVR